MRIPRKIKKRIKGLWPKSYHWQFQKKSIKITSDTTEKIVIFNMHNVFGNYKVLALILCGFYKGRP